MPKYRPQCGGYDESMALQTEITSIAELVDALTTQLGVEVSPAALSTADYGYDHRNGWQTFVVSLDGCGVGFMDSDLNSLKDNSRHMRPIT